MNFSQEEVIAFVRESNSIENIYRDPTDLEIKEFIRFITLPIITVQELEHFVHIYQPGSKIRDKYDMNVRINTYYPPFGGPNIRKDLEDLLSANYSPYILHLKYEILHPFTDCNGRSGRALWAWKNKNITKGFLLNFYFQALNAASGEFK